MGLKKAINFKKKGGKKEGAEIFENAEVAPTRFRLPPVFKKKSLKSNHDQNDYSSIKSNKTNQDQSTISKTSLDQSTTQIMLQDLYARKKKDPGKKMTSELLNFIMDDE